MNSVEGKEFYEIVDNYGNPITTHFTSDKSLKNAVDTYKKFDPDFHNEHYIKVYVATLVADVTIPAPKRLCEDCDSPDHVEGSEACEVSYPKDSEVVE